MCTYSNLFQYLPYDVLCALPPNPLADYRLHPPPYATQNEQKQFASAQQSNDLRNSGKEIGVFNENNRYFNRGKDVSRDFSNSQDNTDRGSMSDQAFACSASSVESLPSASGSSKFSILSSNTCLACVKTFAKLTPAYRFTGTQALVRPGSPHSSISAEDRTTYASICLAKALVDSLPNPYDKEALRFKVSLRSQIIIFYLENMHSF